MSLRITFQIATGQWERRIAELYGPISRTATRAIRAAGEAFKREARASIAAAGFSRRWQNALRVDTFPRRGASANAAMFAFHRVPYAGLFERGGTVQGQPLLWLPLPGAPRRIRRRRPTPASFERHVGPLVSLRRPGGPPLLGAQARLSKRQAQRERPKASLAALRRGDAGRGILRTIPIFIGIDRVAIRKQFDTAGIAARVRDRLAELYARHFRDDRGS